MSNIVQMMDGSYVDLDVVVGISDIHHTGEHYNPNASSGNSYCSLSFFTLIQFDLFVTGGQCISFYNGAPLSNKVTITLDKVHFTDCNEGKDEKFLNNYKLLNPKYKEYEKFIEYWKLTKTKIKEE